MGAWEQVLLPVPQVLQVGRLKKPFLQVPMASSPATPLAMAATAPSSMSGTGSALLHWMADMIAHAFGDPRQEAVTRPPAIGIQPYRDRPRRRARRLP